MANHHYIPLAIIKNFASNEAWKLVERTPETRLKVRELDEQRLKNGASKEWPVCVFDKQKHKLYRTSAGKVCSAQNFYSAPKLANLNEATIARDFIRDIAQTSSGLPNQDPLDPEYIEPYTAEVDSAFAVVTRRLLAGTTIGDKDIDTVLRFIILSRVRTPIWRRVYLPAMITRQMGAYETGITQLSERRILTLDQNDYVQTIKKIAPSLMPYIAIVVRARKEADALKRLDAKVRVFCTDGITPFVTCDNPVRPYIPGRERHLAAERDHPGMAQPGVQMIFPISPTMCIVVARDSRFPRFSYVDMRARDVKKLNGVLATLADTEIILPRPDTSMFDQSLDLNRLRPMKAP
jgi:Protein of unknown function (DUF4238)